MELPALRPRREMYLYRCMDNLTKQWNVPLSLQLMISMIEAYTLKGELHVMSCHVT